MKAGAVLAALALGAVAAGPMLARAQTDPPAPIADDPSCAAYQQTLIDAAKSRDRNEFTRVLATVPDTCPVLKKAAETALEQTLQFEQQQESTEQAYHPPSAVFDDNTIRGQPDGAPPGASADSAASADQASQPPPTEPPGSYDAPPPSGGNPPPAQ